MSGMEMTHITIKDGVTEESEGTAEIQAGDRGRTGTQNWSLSASCLSYFSIAAKTPRSKQLTKDNISFGLQCQRVRVHGGRGKNA